MSCISQVNFLDMHVIYHVYTMYIKEFLPEYPEILNVKYSWQVKDAEHPLRHKLFPPNAWMKLTDFHISIAADRRTLLSMAVPMVLALPHGGAAMFTRSTPGCGTLDGHSLVWRPLCGQN